MALLLSLATYIVIPQERILFGVLHLIGLSYLLTPLLRRIDGNGIAGIVALGLFILFKTAPKGYLLTGTPLPEALYRPWTFFLGFPDAGFYSADYYPLIPWFFLFAAGFFLSTEKILKEESPSPDPIAAAGRRSLAVYLVHQPVLLFFLTFFNCLT